MIRAVLGLAGFIALLGIAGAIDTGIDTLPSWARDLISVAMFLGFLYGAAKALIWITKDILNG